MSHPWFHAMPLNCTAVQSVWYNQLMPFIGCWWLQCWSIEAGWQLNSSKFKHTFRLILTFKKKLHLLEDWHWLLGRANTVGGSVALRDTACLRDSVLASQYKWHSTSEMCTQCVSQMCTRCVRDVHISDVDSCIGSQLRNPKHSDVRNDMQRTHARPACTG